MAREEKKSEMPLPPKKEEVEAVGLAKDQVKPEPRPYLPGDELKKKEDEYEDLVKPVAEPEEKITVVALRKGFYKQSRKSPGDVFQLHSVEHLAKWMKKI